MVSAHGTKQGTVDGAIEAGTMFAGTPDQVFQQIKKHWDHVGGYGHLLIMGQAGFLEHDDTVHGIRMFAREVYPRLKELYPDTTDLGTGDARRCRGKLNAGGASVSAHDPSP